MFAIIGRWPVDGTLDQDQLAHIADTVSRQPGFVRGLWGQERDDVTASYAVIMLNDEESANAMANGVRSAIPTASLQVITILAEASAAAG